MAFFLLLLLFVLLTVYLVQTRRRAWELYDSNYLFLQNSRVGYTYIYILYTYRYDDGESGVEVVMVECFKQYTVIPGREGEKKKLKICIA